MNKFENGFAGNKYLGVGVLSFILIASFTTAVFAETQDTVKSQVMSFAKKKATSEIVESAPSAVAASVKVTEVEAVPAAAPVFMPPASTLPSSMAAKAVAAHTTVVATPVAAPVAAPAAVTAAGGSEAQTKLQAIKTQEQWIAKLTKQLEGEKNQLKEMREGYTQAFGKEDKTD